METQTAFDLCVQTKSDLDLIENQPRNESIETTDKNSKKHVVLHFLKIAAIKIEDYFSSFPQVAILAVQPELSWHNWQNVD